MIMARLMFKTLILFLCLTFIPGIGGTANLEDISYVMQKKNLKAFEEVMDAVGYIIKAHDGIAYGSEDQRQEGTGLCIVRCQENKKWITLAVFSQRGIILRIRKYPAKPPED